VIAVDEFLHPFHALFAGLADLDADLVDDDAGVRMTMERAKIDLPIELSVTVDDAGAVTLVSAPPTQHVATTWMPVFHRIHLTVAADARG
jgi:hypothetical protein